MRVRGWRPGFTKVFEVSRDQGLCSRTPLLKVRSICTSVTEQFLFLTANYCTTALGTFRSTNRNMFLKWLNLSSLLLGPLMSYVSRHDFFLYTMSGTVGHILCFILCLCCLYCVMAYFSGFLLVGQVGPTPSPSRSLTPHSSSLPLPTPPLPSS